MAESILFFNADKEYVLRDKRKIRAWLELCVRKKKRRVGALTFVFCSDSYLRKMNKKFLKHDYNTDIITFAHHTETVNSISGEMYISLDRVKSNASDYGVSFIAELRRVMVHGVLHLCGLNDKTAEETTKMRAEENRLLELLD
ncbi:MAG: rRNA maturation RNase YbeY [Bacteroidota bacterium]